MWRERTNLLRVIAECQLKKTDAWVWRSPASRPYREQHAGALPRRPNTEGQIYDKSGGLPSRQDSRAFGFGE
jgi:hypothetical protein